MSQRTAGPGQLSFFEGIPLGGRVRLLRVRERLTLKQLGERIGLSEGSMSRVEAGKQAVAIETLFALANELHTTAEFLMGFTNDARRSPDALVELFSQKAG